PHGQAVSSSACLVLITKSIVSEAKDTRTAASRLKKPCVSPPGKGKLRQSARAGRRPSGRGRLEFTSLSIMKVPVTADLVSCGARATAGRSIDLRVEEVGRRACCTWFPIHRVATTARSK
ncbi:hypothetical protein BaRGS_00010185, partial [Batillaria attramentaria]